jgi:hypothetical protein
MTTFADVKAAMEEYKAAMAKWQKACTAYLRETGWIEHSDHGAWHHATHIVEGHYWVDTLECPVCHMDGWTDDAHIVHCETCSEYRKMKVRMLVIAIKDSEYEPAHPPTLVERFCSTPERKAMFDEEQAKLAAEEESYTPSHIAGGLTVRFDGVHIVLESPNGGWVKLSHNGWYELKQWVDKLATEHGQFQESEDAS